MAKFDLAFTAFPSRDFHQAEAGLATLLLVHRPGIMARIFPGDTVILHSNLEQHATTGYFRKALQPEDELELIASRERRGLPSQAVQ